MLEDDGELAARVAGTTPTMTLWNDQKAVISALQSGDRLDDATLGYAAFILNRCSRSGMIADTVGPIGGKNQAGRWRIDSRFHAADLADRIRRVAAMNSSITFTEGDGIDRIAELADSGVEDEVVIFADPPYVDDGPRLYRHAFGVAEHLSLAMMLAASPCRWMLTYDRHPLIDSTLYSDFRSLEYTTRHTNNHQHNDTEYAIFSDNLAIDPELPPLPRSSIRWRG